VFAFSRYVSLGSILAAVGFPIFASIFPHSPRTPFTTAVIYLVPLIVIAKHHQNIGRLLNGTEYRFGKARTRAA
jgi:glycerol-3-phosphate acyltransferase PlsY